MRHKYCNMKLHPILYRHDKRKVALVVLTYNNQALILKRSPSSFSNASKWGFPGGGIDKGETPKQAAVRECQEEIGISPKNLEKVGAAGNITWFKGELPCDPSKCLDLDYEEHTAWEMVDPQSIYDFDTIDGMPELIKMVLR